MRNNAKIRRLRRCVWALPPRLCRPVGQCKPCMKDLYYVVDFYSTFEAKKISSLFSMPKPLAKSIISEALNSDLLCNLLKKATGESLAIFAASACVIPLSASTAFNFRVLTTYVLLVDLQSTNIIPHCL